MPGQPILLTGAAGKIARYLRPRLLDRYGALRVSDRVDPAPLDPREEVALGELADFEAIKKAATGCGAVVHMGACIVEESWEIIHDSNILGARNVLEAARQLGIKRVVLASSVHAVGYHPVTTMLDAGAAALPDSFYGISKVFAEGMACLYAEKAGMDIACLRIGSVLPKPTEPRHLSTWLSYADTWRLVQACLDAPRLGYTIMYGCSANTRSWWDNSGAPHVAFKPEDNAEDYAAEVLKNGDTRDPTSPETKFQGGFFCAPDYVKW
ncbi:MAG: NAD(P)-dependent oxidoreductase [Alphaproteobacteria bacterium]|nr:NAD(P)-dependent oxidoreductase [Alphaproteobacteria bacterium]